MIAIHVMVLNDLIITTNQTTLVMTVNIHIYKKGILIELKGILGKSVEVW